MQRHLTNESKEIEIRGLCEDEIADFFETTRSTFGVTIEAPDVDFWRSTVGPARALSAWDRGRRRVS